MTDVAILVDGLSKRYRIGKSPTVKRGGNPVVGNLFKSFEYFASTLREPSHDEVIYALKDVSFEVKQGEVVGIIGRNGAGKSTLLKILSRITYPTRGRATIQGRVGSLLEVGTGFHPELTGRENIYLSGAVLGMKRAEIDRKFDEIVAFAETGRFLDTPVKRYSSGMYVRLAFAVAAHLEPEILMVDEVLAVGDAAFQKKCLGKMGDVATHGRTVLFVSHSMVAIQNLCTRTIWLNEGCKAQIGPSNEVVANYLATSYRVARERVWPDAQAAPGNDRVRIHRLLVQPVNGTPSDNITMDTSFQITIEYWNLIPGANHHVSMHLYNEQQVVVFSTSAIDQDENAREQQMPAGLFRSTCYIPANLLNAGLHRVKLHIHRDTTKIIFRDEEALIFEVLDMGTRTGAWFGKEPGTVRPILEWTTNLIENLDTPVSSTISDPTSM